MRRRGCRVTERRRDTIDATVPCVPNELMNATNALRISRLPFACVLVLTVVFGLAFSSVSWPYVDVHSAIREAATWTWPQYVRYAFTKDVEYRPLWHLCIKLVYELVGLRPWVYQLLVVMQFGAVLALIVWLFKPVGMRRAVAACIALGCVVGLHSAHILFAYWPSNIHSPGLLLLLVTLALAFEPRTRAFDWIFLPLTLAALLVLESGLLLAPLLVVLWWARAPGLGRRGVAGMMVAVVCYFAIRFTFGSMGTPPSVYTGSGLGFSSRTPEDLRNIFENAPWLFWIYNVSATFLTVVLSEPRAGVYAFVASLLNGDTAFWQWVHVGSSLLTTIVTATALIVWRPSSPRDRLLLVTGAVLVVCGSGLGILYARDRIALSAGIGYGLLLYVALAALLERMPAFGWRRALVLCTVTGVAAGWVIRSAETYAFLRDTAWDYHSDWAERFDDLGGNAQPQTEVLTTMRSVALSYTPADPRLDPRWTYTLFERRFAPAGESARASADAAADNAVRPLSAPFDIRWKPDVDDQARARLEAELGLAEAQRLDRDLSGRTWTYRLRRPTRDRVQSIVINPAIEDTARIDAARLEILE